MRAGQGNTITARQSFSWVSWIFVRMCSEVEKTREQYATLSLVRFMVYGVVYGVV
jgi:hypothetical protein